MVVVDKASAIGGSAVYAGFVWTAPTIEVMRRENSGADPALGARLVRESSPRSSGWGRSGRGRGRGQCARVRRGYPVDVAGLMMRCERIVRESQESALLTKSTVERLLVEDGAVRRSRGRRRRRQPPGHQGCSAAAGQRRLGGDPDLRAQLIRPQARDMALRANRQSTGDGLRLGLAAGAASGSSTPALRRRCGRARTVLDPTEFVSRPFYDSEHGVLLNLEGKRLCDETVRDPSRRSR